MSQKIKSSAPQKDDAPSLHRLRLPGFTAGEEIGLGDAIKRATSYIGIQPCAGCAQRADALNRWMTIAGPPSR